MGGLPFVGFKDNVENSIVETIKEKFLLIKVEEEYSGLEAFIDEHKLICLTNGKERTVYAGAVDESSFLEIESLLQVEWDYSTFDE